MKDWPAFALFGSLVAAAAPAAASPLVAPVAGTAAVRPVQWGYGPPPGYYYAPPPPPPRYYYAPPRAYYAPPPPYYYPPPPPPRYYYPPRPRVGVYLGF